MATQPPLKLTREQIEFIRPLLKMERSGDREPNLILAQVRQSPYPSQGEVEIAFCMVDYVTAGKVLNLIESSRQTRYAPLGSRANYLDLLPQGEPTFCEKKKKKACKTETLAA